MMPINYGRHETNLLPKLALKLILDLTPHKSEQNKGNFFDLRVPDFHSFQLYSKVCTIELLVRTRTRKENTTNY